jgi:transglycosylase-like protein with SLT domain/peptidase M23-like protein
VTAILSIFSRVNLRRILAVGVAVAAMFAAVLGKATPAQAPEPSPEPTVVEETATPITSPAPTATAAPTQAPTSSPTAAPTTTSAPTPFPSPVKTTVATPSPTATGTATATPSPTATATPAGKPKKRPKPNSNSGSGKIVKCGDHILTGSLSTSARECEAAREEAHKPTMVPAPKLTNPDGTPAPTNPGFSLATPGAARVGVPNFFIDKFRIPPFLLPIYQAAGMQYGIRWEVLAAINEIETDYGRNLNISSAGALGWMQFMPPTWAMYGVDANGDGVKDPFNPVDAIFAAARYLRAAGGDQDIRRAVFAYNHADWYVDSVLMRAQVIGGLPSDLVGSLTGLTQGRFPVYAKATYAGQLNKKGNKVKAGNAAMVVESDGARRGIDIFSRSAAPVIAANDGKVVKIGASKRLGHFVVLQDVYGNTYTYGHLGDVSKTYPAPKDRSRRHGRDQAKRTKTRTATDATTTTAEADTTTAPDAAAPPTKERLFAHPDRPAARAAGGDLQLATDVTPDALTQAAPLGFKARDFVQKPLKKGARVIGGTILGHLGKRTPTVAPRLTFEIRPAGSGAPRIDPKPILDGWKLLESTAIYRAKGKNPFFGEDAENPSVGQLLLLSKEQLIQRVLHDSRIQIYPCGVSDVRSGQIDRRVLATMLYLAANGLKPTITALKCGHGLMTTSGNVSEHSTGTAMDIGAINGIIIRPATQGPGSITDVTIQALLKLQGTMKPHQIISLMTFQGADNTLAMADHDDHIHVGWRPLYGENRRAARQINAVLKPDQWIKLIARLGNIDNPTVSAQPSRFAVKVKPASKAHRGE